jgi:OMF family outer membrane factor
MVSAVAGWLPLGVALSLAVGQREALVTATAGVTAAAAPGEIETANADAPENVRKLTVSEAASLAVNRSRTLAIRRQELARARAALAQAEAAQFPTLGLGGGATVARTSLADLAARLDPADTAAPPPGLARSDAPTGTVTGSAALTYDLDLGGDRAARIDIARRLAAIAELELVRTMAQLRQDVTNAAYDLQEGESEVTVGQSAIASALQNLADAEVLKASGEATVFDVHQARLNVVTAQQAASDGDRKMRLARRSLARLLDLDLETPLAVADPVKPGPDWPLPLDASIDRALAGRPEPAQQVLGREVALLHARQAAGATSVRASLFANGDTTAMPLPGAGAATALGTLGPGLGYAAGVTLQWVALDWGAARQGVLQGEADAAAAELRLADARADIVLEVRQAFTNLAASKAAIALATQARAIAQEGAASARDRFQSGVGTQTDVILAQEALNRAEIQRIRSTVGYNRALAALDRATQTDTAALGSVRPADGR